LIKRATNLGGDEVVELYVLNKKGEMEDTNISCPVDATTHEYQCSDIAANQDYIVRYMKDLGDGRIYEMKTNVVVGDSDVTGEKVNKVTSVIADAISKAIENALTSVTTMDDKTIKTLMVSIKQSVVKSVSSLIEKGLIQIPDDSAMIVKLEKGKTFSDYKASTQENENLQKVSDVVVSDNSVVKVLDSSKNEAKLQSYATMTHKQIIAEIFKQFGDGDVPGWIVEFLSDKYSTQLDIAGVVKETTFTPTDLNHNQWVLDDFKRLGVNLTQDQLTTILKDMTQKLNENIHNGDLLKSFKASGEEYLKAKETNNVDILAKFPPILGFLFGKGLPTEKFENVGQGVVFALYAEDVYAADFVKKYLQEKYQFDDTIADGISQMDLIDFNPGFIFAQLGLDSQTVQKYNKPEIQDIEIKTDIFWDDSQNKEKEIMTLHADMTKAVWLLTDTTFKKDDLKKVTLTYPTAKGNVTKDLNLEDIGFSGDNGDGFGIEYSPWAQQDGTENKAAADITNNISGEYTLTVQYGEDTFTKTVNKVVLKGLQSYYPELETPLASPRYPDILNNIDWASNQTLTKEQEAAQQQFDKEEQKFMEATNGNGYTTFAPDANGTLQDLVITWDDSAIQSKIASLNLPKNIIPAYEVGISLYNADLDGDGKVSQEEEKQCDENWDQCNTEIFNTWWDNRPLTTTSLLLPISLQANVGDGRYQVHTDLIFVDTNTGEEIAHGGHSDAEFKIAKVADLSGNEVIDFKGQLITDSQDITLPDNIKIAFVQNSCEFDKDTLEQICQDKVVNVADVSSNGTYSLSVNAKTIKDMFLSNSGTDFSLVAFQDLNNNGKWDNDSDADQTEYEQEWYPESTWFNFETWGGFKIGVTYGDEDNKYESFSITPDKNISISGIDFQLYGLSNEDNESE